MIRPTRLLLLAVAIMGITACQSNTGPSYARQDEHPSEAGGPITVEPPLQPFLVCDKAAVTHDNAGLMRVSVPVRLESRRGEESWVQYRFTFLNHAGVPLHQQEDFRRMLLPSREQVFMRGVARDVGAASWRLYIRPAR